jgi:serine acetyltransferase
MMDWENFYKVSSTYNGDREVYQFGGNRNFLKWYFFYHKILPNKFLRLLLAPIVRKLYYRATDYHNCSIPIEVKIQRGINLPHPLGIVIHPNVSIGPNCTIFHQVTLTSMTKLLGHVDIGAGAKVLGVTIGKHCVVGANSVVTRDVPDYSVMVGVPAIEKRRLNPNDFLD